MCSIAPHSSLPFVGHLVASCSPFRIFVDKGNKLEEEMEVEDVSLAGSSAKGKKSVFVSRLDRCYPIPHFL